VVRTVGRNDSDGRKRRIGLKGRDKHWRTRDFGGGSKLRCPVLITKLVTRSSLWEVRDCLNDHKNNGEIREEDQNRLL